MDQTGHDESGQQPAQEESSGSRQQRRRERRKKRRRKRQREYEKRQGEMPIGTHVFNVWRTWSRHFADRSWFPKVTIVIGVVLMVLFVLSLIL